MSAQLHHFTEDCVECGKVIAIGDEFFMRNDPHDGTNPNQLAAALEALTYDAVCRSCGERQLRQDAN